MRQKVTLHPGGSIRTVPLPEEDPTRIIHLGKDLGSKARNDDYISNLNASAGRGSGLPAEAALGFARAYLVSHSVSSSRDISTSILRRE